MNSGGLTEKGREELEKRVPKAVFIVLCFQYRKTFKIPAGRALRVFSVSLISSTIVTDSQKVNFSEVSKAS